MTRFIFTFICIALIAFPILAQEQDDAQQTAAVKAAVAKIGSGTKDRVSVTRLGKPKVKGFIREIREDDFELISTDNGSIGVAIHIPYREVIKISGKGVDWRSTGLKASWFGLKALKVMGDVIKGTCLGPISRCSP
jgi:hypothetical protein